MNYQLFENVRGKKAFHNPNLAINYKQVIVRSHSSKQLLYWKQILRREHEANNSND